MTTALHPEAAAGLRAAPGGPLSLPALLNPEGELVRLAPDRRECRAPGWLADAAARLAREMAPGGMAYVLPPRGWRGRTARQLRRAGLRVEAPLAHLPGGGAERCLLPLRAAEASFLARALLPLPSPARRLVLALARLPGWPRVAAETWPAVGLLAWREGGRPPLGWLAASGCDAEEGTVLVQGWRGGEDSVLLHRVSPDGRLAAVGKVARAGATADEAETLARLGDAARAAGAAVPRVLGAGRVAGRRFAVLEALPGERAAWLLRGRPERVAPAVDRLAAWLEAWGTSTRAVSPLRRDELEREVLVPLARLAPRLPDGEAYATRVRSLCAHLEGATVPRVAAHGDLTMHNVLLAADSLGIVDWEAGRGDGFPLADLEYAAVDAAAAAAGYRDRPRAWLQCFSPGGAYAAVVRRGRERLAAALELPEPFAELCSHACWLHHAANEERAAGAGGERPFLEVLRLLAAEAARVRG